MSNNTIDNFFNDNLADHEWLDAKDKNNAPFTSHNPWEAKDPLAMMWMHGAPSPDVNVTKPDGRVETVTTDGHMVTQDADGKTFLTDQDGRQVKVNPKVLPKTSSQVKKVVDEIKRQLMLGRDLTHIKASIIDKLSPELKVAAKNEIVKVAKEFPLLGSVYIETAPFATDNGVKGCEIGSSLLKGNQSRMAIYAVEMPKCGDCSYNRGGTCGLYKKKLVAEVKYDEKTLDHYQKHLALSRKVASDEKISSKEELRNALMGVSSGTREATTVVYHDESKLQASRKSSKETPDTFQSKEAREIAKDLSLHLASGVTPESFKEYIVQKYATQVKSYPEVFQRYAAFVGSLGRVFVELSPFQSVRDAAAYYRALPAPYILTDGRRVTDIDKTLLGKKVVSSLKEIPMEEWTRNLRGMAFNAQELEKNPLGATKKAFLNSPRSKTASAAEDMYEMDQPLNNAVGDKFLAKNASESSHKTQKEFARAKTAERTSSDNVTVDGNMVRIKADKGLEIEIGQSDFDESVRKSL